MKTPWEMGSDAGAKLSTFSARKQGAIMFAIGIAAIAFALLVGGDGAPRKLLFIGVTLLPVSLWVIATGRAGTRNEPKPPLWWWAGAIIVLLVALLAALGATAIVKG